MNAALLARHPIGKESDAVADMQQFWINAASSQLYKDWTGGIVDGLLFHGGLYNSEPLKDFLTTQFDQFTSERDTTIGLVNYLSGEYEEFTQSHFTNKDDLVNLMFASFSIPLYFEPAEVFGSAYFDGSAIWDIDITAIINQCLNKGYAQEDIVIDTIMI